MEVSPPIPREQFPVTQRYAYLNHAGVAPLPAVTVAAVAAEAARARDKGTVGLDERDEEHETIRGLGAKLMGVPSTDIAFVKNTTEGLGFVANGLDWSPGDVVVVPDLEFPSTLYPWLALDGLGVRVVRVAPLGPEGRLPLDSFRDAIAASRPRLVACSWVQFGRGWRTDLAALAELCRDNNTLLCADVIQGLGALPAELEQWGVDFAVADAHKWLLGPEGIGLFYVRQERRDLLRPLEPGWASVLHRKEWDNLELIHDDSARRFEGGTPNALGLAGLGASLRLLETAGMDSIWHHISRLCDHLVERLRGIGLEVVSDRSPEGRSGIVTFLIGDRDPAATRDRLEESGFVCSARAGGLRVSPHAYNEVDEVDAFIDALEHELSP
ncbi:MAG: Cysteine desulfurase SufS [Acidimicrobiales bacterium]|nr:Cysteine desulfurase SufS [Acidimicrobiales bacterium]